MNENENEHKGPGEAAGDGQARHGYRNEVSWDGGKGSQPYANQGSEEQASDAAPQAEGGNRGDASGRNLEQLEEVSGKPVAPQRQAPRDAG
jgi:hypothetical protein